jgi:N-methylhydantoinase B
VRDYRLLAESAELTTTFGRHRYPPWGAHGGQPGSTNGVAVFPHASAEPTLWRGKVARHPLRRGDVARLVTGTGGGYGDPRRRAPERVRQDVRDGLLTPEQAARIYGWTEIG